MEKRNLIMTAVTVMAFACVACAGKSAKITGVSDEIALPENTEVPSAVETVEKIINDEDVINVPVVDEEIVIENEDSSEPVSISVYYVQGSFDNYLSEEVEIERLDPEFIITELAKHNIVPIDTQVVVFECDQNKLTLELSKTFDDYMVTMSEDAKGAIETSISKTFSGVYDVDEVVLVNLED